MYKLIQTKNAYWHKTLAKSVYFMDFKTNISVKRFTHVKKCLLGIKLFNLFQCFRRLFQKGFTTTYKQPTTKNVNGLQSWMSDRHFSEWVNPVMLMFVFDGFLSGISSSVWGNTQFWLLFCANKPFWVWKLLFYVVNHAFSICTHTTHTRKHTWNVWHGFWSTMSFLWSVLHCFACIDVKKNGLVTFCSHFWVERNLYLCTS